DRERAYALRPLLAGDVGRFDDGARRRPARAHDDPGPLVGHLVVLQAGVADRLLHRDMIPGRAAAEKAHRAPVYHLSPIEARGAMHLRAESHLGLLVGA